MKFMDATAKNAAEAGVQQQQDQACTWFASLRDSICATFVSIEADLEDTMPSADRPAGQFERKNWQRDGGGGGESGNVAIGGWSNVRWMRWMRGRKRGWLWSRVG